MGAFRREDWDKHDYLYTKELIRDLENGEQIAVDQTAANKLKRFKLGETINKEDFVPQELNKIIKAFNEEKYDTVSYDDFNSAFKHKDKVPTIFIKLSKLPYSQGRKGNTTVQQENGFAIWLDYLVNNNKTAGERFDRSQYKPSDKLRLSEDSNKQAAMIDDAINFMADDKTWDDANKKCALKLLQYCKSLNVNLDKYYIHRGTDLFKKIKKVGATLAVLNADKWNPADVMLIKNEQSVASKLDQFAKDKNIAEYNRFIGSNDDVIGISLKKGDTGALHGSFAVNQLTEFLGQHGKSAIDWKDFKSTVITTRTDDWGIFQCLKTLHDISDVIKPEDRDEKLHRAIIYINPGKLGSNTPTIKQLVDRLTAVISPNGDKQNTDVGLNAIKKNIDKQSFIRSFPAALKFLTHAYQNKERLEEAIETAYCIAGSMHEKCCPHLKVTSDSIKQINKDAVTSVQLNKIVVPLDGSIHILFDLMVVHQDGHESPIKLQLRSKGSAPQFIIIKEQIKTDTLKPLKQYKLQ